MSFPDGLKFRLLYGAGVEFLAPDMGIQFLHGGNRRYLDGAVVKVRDVAGAAICKNVNGAEGQPITFYISLIEDDRRFSFRCFFPKELDVFHFIFFLPISRVQLSLIY